MIDESLENALKDAWAATTAAGDNEWTPANPAAGHCDVTSLVIRERLGGDLKMAQVFRDGALSEHHYWNALPNGSEFDLTAEQFSGDETFGTATTMDAESFASAGPLQPALVERLDMFRRRVERNLVSASSV